MFITLINPYFQSEESFKDHLLVNVTQIVRLNRLEILKHLVNRNKMEASMSGCNLVSINPRNFHLDVLMTKNQDIYYDEEVVDEDNPLKALRMFKLPLTFEIVVPDINAEIACHQDNINMNLFTVIQKIGEGTYA